MFYWLLSYIHTYMHMYMYIIVTCDSHSKFTDCLTHQSRAVGMTIHNKPYIEDQNRRRDISIDQVLDSLKKRLKGLQLILVILPKKGSGSGYGMCLHNVHVHVHVLYLHMYMYNYHTMHVILFMFIWIYIILVFYILCMYMLRTDL